MQNKTPTEIFGQRKKDHIDISLKEESQVGLDQFSAIELQHKALPEIDFSEIDIQSEVFDYALKSPLFVSSMTLGHGDSSKVNELIAKQCSERGWMMGVGSQRRQLFDKKAYQECEALRKKFPDMILFGNIGLAQVIKSSSEDMQSLVDTLGAQFLVVHTNPMQEAFQKEGTPQFRGGTEALRNLSAHLDCPVVLKETGCGFSSQTLNDLKEVGLKAVDVSGLGGTHWGRIEGLRQNSESIAYRSAQTFSHWGISTVDSLLNALKLQSNYEVWASGGVRSGLDAAKLLALGATKVGYAQPILQAVMQGESQLQELMEQLEFELKVAMFCLGCHNLNSLVGNEALWKWK